MIGLISNSTPSGEDRDDLRCESTDLLSDSVNCRGMERGREGGRDGGRVEFILFSVWYSARL